MRLAEGIKKYVISIGNLRLLTHPKIKYLNVNNPQDVEIEYSQGVWEVYDYFINELRSPSAEGDRVLELIKLKGLPCSVILPHTDRIEDMA